MSTAQSVGVFNTPCGMAVCAGNGAGASSAQSGGSASDIGSLGELAKTTASDIVEGAKNVAAGVGSAMFPEAWGSAQGGEVESTASDLFWGAWIGAYNTGARTVNGLNDLPYLLHGMDPPRRQTYSVFDTPPEMRKAAGTVEIGMSVFGVVRMSGGVASGASIGVRITEKGLARLERHLAQFADEANSLMVQRLRAGNVEQQGINFYLHELKESAFMKRGLSDRAAHEATLEWQGIPYAPGYEAQLYHRDVISAYRESFSPAARRAAGVE